MLLLITDIIPIFLISSCKAGFNLYFTHPPRPIFWSALNIYPLLANLNKVFFNDFLKQTLDEINEACLEDEESERRTDSQKLMAYFLYAKASIISHMCPKKDSSIAIDSIKLCESIINKLMFQETSLNNKGLLNFYVNFLKSNAVNT